MSKSSKGRSSTSAKDRENAKSLEIAHAEQRASQLWNIPEVRLRVLDLLDLPSRIRMLTVNLATFDSCVQVLYRSIHLTGYEKLIARLIPRGRLDTYITNIHTLDITGCLPTLRPLFDCYSLFEIIPTLRSVSWSTGTLRRTSGADVNPPRFECDIEARQSRHDDMGRLLKGALRDVPNLRFLTNLNYNVTILGKAHSSVQETVPLNDLFYAKSRGITSPYMVQRLDIRSNHRIPEVTRCLEIGYFSKIRLLRINSSPNKNQLKSLIDALPKSCTDLAILASDQAVIRFDDLLEVIRDIGQHHVKRLSVIVVTAARSRHLPFWITIASIRSDHRQFVPGNEAELLLGSSDSRGQAKGDSRDQGDMESLEIQIRDYRCGSSILPPMSLVASDLLVFGGPLCRYTIKVERPPGKSVDRATEVVWTELDSLLTRQLRQEIAMIQERRRIAEGPGWTRR